MFQPAWPVGRRISTRPVTRSAGRPDRCRLIRPVSISGLKQYCDSWAAKPFFRLFTLHFWRKMRFLSGENLRWELWQLQGSGSGSVLVFLRIVLFCEEMMATRLGKFKFVYWRHWINKKTKQIKQRTYSVIISEWRCGKALRSFFWKFWEASGDSESV